MSSPRRKTPKSITLYDPNQPGRSRTVLETEAQRWKDAGWSESPTPAPKDTDTKSD